MTPTTYIVVALIGVTVGAALGIIGASWRSDRRIADLEAENLGLRNEVALAAGRPPAHPNGHGRHRQDTTPPAPTPPLHAHIADDLTVPIAKGVR
jgi:hypothetical protein